MAKVLGVPPSIFKCFWRILGVVLFQVHGTFFHHSHASMRLQFDNMAILFLNSIVDLHNDNRRSKV